jgi:hypothetical protein
MTPLIFSLLITSFRPEIVEHRGIRGDWFTPAQSSAIVRKFEEQKKLIELQDRRAAALKHTVATATRTVALQDVVIERIELLSDTRSDIIREQQAELKRADSIWRHPLLWALAGALVGVIVGKL